VSARVGLCPTLRNYYYKIPIIIQSDLNELPIILVGSHRTVIMFL
jgi:hypothetical protein